MEDLIYVIGHKNPDTDSIASAMAYAELKNQLGEPAVAKRLGTLNEETKFATRYFGVESPDIMNDARTQLKDLNMDKPVLISKNYSCNEVYDYIIKTKSRTTYVVDEDKKLLGLVSVGDLANLRLLSQKEREDYLKTTNVDMLASDVDGYVVYRSKNSNFSGKVYVIDELTLNNQQFDLTDSICIINDSKLVNRLIIDNAACVIVSNYEVEVKDTINANTSVICTDLSIIEIIRLIYESFPIYNIMTKDITGYHEDDFIEDVIVKVTSTRFRSYPVLNDENQVVGSISRYHLFKHRRKQFVLVDHSSKIQSIDYIDKAEIVEIIDHHHVGDIQTDKPIYYRNQRYGCTCTIIYQMYKENEIIPTKATAGMMLSAIISDTLKFKSETTRKVDIETAKALAEIAGVDLDEYADELLSASVNLKDGNVYELMTRDLKNYKFNDYSVAVGQTNYSNLEDIQSRLEEFKEALMHEQSSKQYDLIVMMFTHVLGEGTMFVFYGPLSSLMFEVIGRKFDEHSGYDHKIMSRKQQLIPELSEVIKNH